jgi:hypothetical protein
VVNHEQSHLSQFENINRYPDREIISEDITISHIFVDGNFIAVADKTTPAANDWQCDIIELQSSYIESTKKEICYPNSPNLTKKS